MNPRRPLPPDVRHEPVFHDELTLEVTYSRTKRFRAVITRDANGRYRVRRQRWEVPAFEHTGGGHWLTDRGAMILAVNLEIARELAEEKLTESGDGPAKESVTS